MSVVFYGLLLKDLEITELVHFSVMYVQAHSLKLLFIKVFHNSIMVGFFKKILLSPKTSRKSLYLFNYP
ncbi:hypothetical protein RO3G_09410 [Rhizopus delemar RA 99-880]|uniref:Uncharacterized protein n=1 Tax=Rhizopus delemar (strain RA 99-880 / ATCC MYA-4621 / FGSC 9543 / NRRL 43880) TaxID=246409 RepID=I1C8C0_RHIO9|nr:hypothetical protein RO3G_09410 [Rhizopus delemar RA 99-880]|eukprot:EIE84700.1 hypothetical protein RO3G_09410 [Rhizopus delemar RA 99-880]